MEARTDKHEFLGTFRLIKSGFLNETALMQFLPLWNIVPTMVTIRKREKQRPSPPPRNLEIFHTYQTLTNQPPDSPLVREGLEVEPY